ncbi:MAG: hypothetical protein R8K49_08250, partial [Mariprofundaceae bacterium]
MLNVPEAVLSTVGEIAHMGVITAGSDATIEEAVQMMLKHDLRDVIFEMASEHYIFTTSDLLDYVHKSSDLSV